MGPGDGFVLHHLRTALIGKAIHRSSPIIKCTLSPHVCSKHSCCTITFPTGSPSLFEGMAGHRNHPLSGGPYRWVRSFNQPWEASPVIPESPKALDDFPWNPTWVHEETKSERVQRLGIRSKTRGSCASFWSCLKDAFSTFHDINAS